MRHCTLLASLLATFALSATVAFPGSARADGKLECTTDGSLSFEFCVGLKYDEVRDGDQRFVRLNRARAEVRLKDRQVRIRRVTLGGNVLGRCLTTCGELGAIDAAGRLGRTAGKGRRTVVSERPPWSRWYVQVGGVSHQCAVVIVDWSRGTKTFRSLHDRCVGAPFDSLSLADRDAAFTKIAKIRGL